jgi:serine/threonine-protein kinase SRK2
LIKNVTQTDVDGNVKETKILKLADFGISGIADQFNP